MALATPTSPTYSPQTQEALETMAARVLLSVGVIRVTALAGPEINLGFEPQWLLIKSSTDFWWLGYCRQYAWYSSRRGNHTLPYS
jgi:hypothetical protein